MAKKTMLEQAQKAYKKGQKVREKQKKKKVVTTEKPKVKQPKPAEKKKEQPKVSKQESTYKPSPKSSPKSPVKSKKDIKQQYKSFTGSAYKPTKFAAKTKKKPYDAKSDAKQAYLKGRNRTYLGTEQKQTTTKLKDGSKLKSVNALTRQEFEQMKTAQAMGRKQGNKYLKNVGGDKLLKKVGSKTAESAVKGKFVTGAMQGSGFADVITGSVGKYDKQAKKALKETKKSGAYMAGYVAGQIGGFGLTKTNAAGRAIAQAGAKGAAKATGKGLGKKFAKNRAGEMIAEAPMNALDAAKMATDENGKINKKELAKYMALNTGLTGAAGGALEGAAMKKASSNVKKLTELLGKQKAGTITDAEVKQLDKVRAAVRKSAKNTDSLSGEVSAKGLEDIKSAESEARLQKARQGALDNEAPGGFGVNKSRGQGKYTEEAQAKAYNARMDRARESAEKSRAAQKHADGAAASAERSREAERFRLQDKANDIRRQIAETEDAMKTEGRQQAYVNLQGKKQNLQKQLDHTEEMLRNTEAGTYSGRVKANLKAQKTSGTMLGHETAVREGENLIEEGKARANAAFADDAAEATVKETTETTGQNATKAIDDEIARSEETLKKLSDPDEVDELEQHIEDLKAQKSGRTPQNVKARKELEQRNKELVDARGKLDNANDALRGALAHGENSKKAHGGQISPQTQAEIETARKAKAEAQKAYDEAAAAEKEARNNFQFAQAEGEYADEVGLTVKDTNEAGEKLTKADIEAQKLGTMKEDLAQIDDDIANAQRRLAEATGDNAGAIRKEIEALRQQRMVVASAIENNASRKALMQAEQELAKAVTKQKTGLRKFIAKANRAFVDSFGDWESVFRSFDDAKLRDRAFAKLQKLRMSRSEAASKVYDEFLTLYEKFGLVGRKNKQKLEDFERYTFLQHELERIDDGTGFTGMAREQVESELATLQGRYAKDLVEGADGELIPAIDAYQQSVVKYFDDLLERDVQSGFDTAEHAAELRGKFKNYVPTFRDSDGLDAISRAKPFEEINFHRVHAAVGGDSWDVLPLHKQAMQKTQATLIRQNENDLVSFVAEIAQVDKKGLVSGKTPQEYLESTTMTIKEPKTGKYKIAYFADGEKKTLEISEGMYKGIRQWTGEDRLFFMNSKLVNFVTGKINRYFKDWITDYSLIFGARNFVRDLETGLFYSSHPLRYAKNIPRAVSCVLADTKFGKAIADGKVPGIPEGFREYVKEGQMLTNAYRANGGRMGQLVSESDPYKMLRRLHRKNGPLGVIREINSTIETIPRMAEFASAAEEAAMKRAGIPSSEWGKLSKTAKRRWMNEAVGDPDVLASAMNRSKEVTLNFDRSGYIGRWLNSTFVPFFNPAIQGADKLTRVLVRDNHTAAEWTKMVVMFGVIGQGSEIFMNAMYAGNEAYQRLTDYEKTGYYHIPAEWFGGDKDNFIKIPRAREIAASQGPVGWFMQHVKYHCAGEDENLFGSFKSNAKIWWEQIGPVSPISDNIFYTPYRIGKKGQTWYGGYIEDFDEQELVKEGKSDQVWDENTTVVAKGINKMLLEGSDKLKFIGFSDAQIKNIRSHVWSPKKIDDLLDSYMGVIYDMGIKNTSMKNSSMTEAVEDFKAGSYGKGTLGLANIFGSSFGTAFAVDSVMSNAYKSNQYAKKADLQGQLDKMTKGLEEGTPEYEKVIKSEEYMKTNAALRRLNQSFAYTSGTYDSLMSNIYLREDMTSEQKNYWARQIKKQQNGLLYGRQQGDVMANQDPMKWGYNAKRKDGSRLFTNDELVDLCSFTYNDGGNATREAWDRYKKLNPKDKGGKSFFEVLLTTREVNRVTGEPLSMVQYNVNAYTIAAGQAKKGKTYDKVIDAFEPYGNTTLRNAVNDAQRYYQNGGNLGMYKYSHRDVVQGGIDLNVATYEMESWDMVNSLARGQRKNGKEHSDLAYYAEGRYVLRSMNAARCLASDKHKKENVDTMSVFKFCKEYGFTYKEGKENYPKAEDVTAAINKKYKKCTDEVKAAVFEEIMGTWVENPFGKIGDYSHDDDTGISYPDGYGHGRRRRGRHGRGGWGWGGGGRGSSFTPEVNTAGGGAKEMKFEKLKSTDFTKKSNLNEAYRKKLRKNRKESRATKA